MTNFFQCYDVPLATNDNFLTLRVTDTKGSGLGTWYLIVICC